MVLEPRNFLLRLRDKQRDLVGYDPRRQALAWPQAWRDLVSPDLVAALQANMLLRASEFDSFQDELLTRLQTMIVEKNPECAGVSVAVGELFLSFPQAKILRLREPWHGFVIALHTHFSHLARCIAVTAMSRIRLDNELTARIGRQELYEWVDAYTRFFFLREGSLPSFPDPCDEADLVLTELSFVACLLWVLCHEYGHYLAGHFEGGPLHTFHIGGIEVESCEGGDANAAAWRREYQADIIGCDLLVRAVGHEAFSFRTPGDMSESERLSLAADGLELAIALLGLVDRRYVLHGKKQYSAGSHPPAHLRLQNLQKERPAVFRKPPMIASIVTGYFDALYKGLPGTHELRPP